MFSAIASLLAWFYSLVPNYAVAIALLTLAIMLILTPLTLKGQKSMIQMQRLQPEMKKLQQQYKGDRQKLNEELMKFYQEHKINPLGGCLPLVVQLPVFFVLYRVIRGLTKKSGAFFNPAYISKTSRLYVDLSHQKQMVAFGMDLSRSALNAFRDNVAQGIPYLVLIVLVTATSYYQQRQITARSKTGQAMNAQQQMLMRLM